MTRGRANPGRRSSAAFTLLEIVLVLALFGLIATLTVGLGATLLRDTAAEDAEQQTLGAIAQVRRQAVLDAQTLELRYDAQTRTLDWGLGRQVLAGEEDVQLLPPVRVSAMLLGGQLVESALERVRFYPDGTCDPFRLGFTRGRVTRQVTIDPWTCSALAAKPEDRP